MKILKVIPFFTPEMGGSAEVAYQLSVHLSQLGHDVTVVTTDYGRAASRFPEGNFEVVYLPNLFAGFGFYLSPKLIGWAKDNLANFDIVHMHTLRTFQNGIIHYYCQKLSIPYILSAHGTLPVFMQRKLPKRIYDFIIGRKLLNHASYLHAVSEVEFEQYQQAGISGDKIILISNGLDLESIPRQTLDEAVNASSTSNVKRILFVGRLHQIKRADVLIKAFAKLPEPKNYRLIIVGPDEGELSTLQALSQRLGVETYVTFTGPLYGEEKYDQYRQADLVVLPSSYEIFGLVPFEALMFGKPVVVSDRTGAGILIEKIDAGYVYSVNEINDLCKIIDHIFNNPDEAQRKVETGQAYIRAHLSWAAIAMESTAMYQQGLGK